MNHWKVTGILHRDAVKSISDNHDVINFTATNVVEDDIRNHLQWRKIWIDCVWHTPDLTLLEKLTKGLKVHLEGRVYQRRAVYGNNSGMVYNIALEIEHIVLLGAADK